MVTCRPFYDKDGVLAGSVHIIKDITEHKRAEEELTALYRRFREEAELSRFLLDIIETLNNSLVENELMKKVLSLSPGYLRSDKASIYLYADAFKTFVCHVRLGCAAAEQGMLTGEALTKERFPALERNAVRPG